MSTFPSSSWVDTAVEAVNDDAEFERFSRAFDATIRFDFGDYACALTIDDGAVREVHYDPTFATWDFALRASEGTWRKMLAEVPPPLHNDLLGAWLRGDMTMEGDLKVAIQHIRPLKRMLAVFQEVGT
ncbi:hypothetical protein [Haloferax sp. YSMS24]|uniref:hypothetical protein n=1 Tax=unclassified Haloferax TaxID=2625095 RepID=UPI00398D2C2A